MTTSTAQTQVTLGHGGSRRTLSGPRRIYSHRRTRRNGTPKFSNNLSHVDKSHIRGRTALKIRRCGLRWHRDASLRLRLSRNASDISSAKRSCRSLLRRIVPSALASREARYLDILRVLMRFARRPRSRRECHRRFVRDRLHGNQIWTRHNDLSGPRWRKRPVQIKLQLARSIFNHTCRHWTYSAGHRLQKRMLAKQVDYPRNSARIKERSLRGFG